MPCQRCVEVECTSGNFPVESSVAATVSPAPQEGTKKRRQRGRREPGGGASMAGQRDDRVNERRKKQRDQAGRRCDETHFKGLGQAGINAHRCSQRTCTSLTRFTYCQSLSCGRAAQTRRRQSKQHTPTAARLVISVN